MFSTQQYSGFDPRTIPGCQLWLDAADSNTVTTSGSTLTGWIDKSGTGKLININSAPTYSSTGFNNLPGITFASGNNLSTITQSLGTAITLVAVYRVTSNTTSVALSVGLSGGGETGIGYNINNTYYVLYDWAVNESGNITNRTINTNVIHIGVKSGTTLASFINGTDPTSVPSSTYNNTNSTINIGGGSLPFVGTLSEAIVYNNGITTLQRQQIEGYLAWKWGLNTNLPSNHLFKSNPIVTRIFQPTDISGCFLWLDGADAKTVSVSGTNVTAWNDKSGLGNNLTTISATPPTYSSTTGAITFTAANQNVIRGPLNTTYTNPITTFVVCLITSSGSDGARNLLNFGTSGSPASFLAGQYTLVLTPPVGSPSIITYANNAQNPTGQGTNIQTYIPTTYNTIGIFENLSTYSGTNLTNNTYLNGNTSTYSAVNTTWTVASPYTTNAAYAAIGNDTAGTGGTGGSFNGNIYEVLAFSKTLSTSERQQIEGYLAAKWGLSVTLPISHPFTTQRTTTGTFRPTDITGCQLWLDAADNSTVSFASGSNISQWNDKSGNGYNATQSLTGRYPTYNSVNKCVNFTRTSNSYFLLPDNALPTGNSSYTYYISLCFTTTADGLGVIGGGNWGTTNGVFAFRAMMVYWWGNDFSAPGSSYTANVPMVFMTDWNGTTRTMFKNGTQIATNNTTARNQGSSNNAIGATNNLAEFMEGFINEIVVFNRALTSNENRQMESYLMTKWGVGGSPATIQRYSFLRALPSTPYIISIPGFDTLTLTKATANTISAAYVAKYNQNGRLLWAGKLEGSTTGGTNGNVFPNNGNGTMDSSGNVYVVGQYNINQLDVYSSSGTVAFSLPSASSNRNQYIVKYNTLGVAQWGIYCETNSTITTFVNSGLKVDATGNVYMFMTSAGSGASYNLYNSDGTLYTSLFLSGITGSLLVQISPTGFFNWYATVDGPGSDTAYRLELNTTGPCITGHFNSTTLQFNNSDGSTFTTLTTNSGNIESFFAQYDTSGFGVWAAKGGGTAAENGYGIATDTTDNSVYFTGYTISNPITFTAWNSATTLTWNGSGTSQDAYIVKYNSLGIPQWACGVSSSANDLGWTMCVDGNRNLYVSIVTSGTSITIFDSAGGTTTLTRPNGTTCNLIIQYSSSGSYLGVFRIDGLVSASTSPMIAVDSANNLYLATFSSSNPIEIYDKSGSLTTSISYTGTNLAFLTKFNSSGIYLWHARQTSAGSQNITGVGISSSRDIAITGRYAETTFTICSTGF